VSIVRGSQPAPPPDLTYAEAEEQRRLDFVRLLYDHELFWRIDENGKVSIGCCCSEIEFGVTIQQREHIQGAVRKVRGPIKR